MDQFTFDFRQLATWDVSKQPPTPLGIVGPKRPLPPNELAALKSALRFGKAFSPILETADEIADIASKPLRATILLPSKLPITSTTPPIIVKLSSSRSFTEALGVAASAAAVVGANGSLGFYASTTREVGFFSTVGGGIIFNSPSLSLGAEVTWIFGTPADFSGPYFGLAVGGGVGVSGTVTLLFAPTLPLSVPLTLTL